MNLFSGSPEQSGGLVKGFFLFLVWGYNLGTLNCQVLVNLKAREVLYKTQG